MSNIFRIITGILLIPLCVSMFRTLLYLISSLGNEWGYAISGSAIAFSAGFLIWLAVFIFLPRPVTAYVFAHELTHAIWAFFSGASVKRFSVSGKGGSVVVSSVNFLTALAPYCIPFYTVLTILAYYTVWLFIDPSPFEPLWLGLLGATWCFHVTFTVKALMHEQSDIRKYGYIFSYGVIFLANITMVCLGLTAVSSVTLETFITRAGDDIVWLWRYMRLLVP